MAESIPLFPLNTVLFPHSTLGLRIFEPRYLAMVGERMKSGRPFGVVLIKQGQEAGDAATFHRVGTCARIVDFDQLDDGLLGLHCVGEQRFKVTRHSTRPDQLIIGEIEPCSDNASSPASHELLEAHRAISDFLRHALQPKAPAHRWPGGEEIWNDFDWVSFQTAELLMRSTANRQLFLEMSSENRLFELSRLLEATPLQ